MRTFLRVGLVALAFSCGVAPSPEAARGAEQALSVSNIRTVAPSSAVGLAEEQQRDPDIVAGPAGEQLVVWDDQRNFRLHASDIYAALIRDGGVVHPLGVPVATGSGNEDEPHVGFDGVAYTVAWSERSTRVLTARFVSPTDAFEPRVVSLDSRRPRVAAGAGYTLVMYRRNIGWAEGVLVGPDGGVQTLRDGGTTLTFSPASSYQGALAAEWSPTYGAFLIAIGDNVQGLYLARLDPHPLDGGLPLPDAPVLISSQPFPTDTYFTSGVELATSPGGHIGAAWRVGSDSYVAVMQTVPQANFPQGTNIETATSGSPGISWTGSRFRVAVTSATASRLLDLSLGGIPNEVSTGAAFPSANDCQTCPPVVLEGRTIVRTVMNGAPFGPDLTLEQRDEIGTTTGVTTITQSASASHAPSAAWSSDGGLLLVWSSADDGGLVRHDVRYRRYNPNTGLMSAPVALAPNSSRDDSYPRVQWSLGRWWVATAGPASVTSGSANIYTATDALAFANSLSQPSNGPAALADGWAVASDIDHCEVRRLVSDGTLGSLAEGPYTSAWFPEIAVDSVGNPMVISVSRPGAGENVDVSANGVGGPHLTSAAGDPRAAAIASDGTNFTSIYTERDSQQMTLRRQDLRLLSDAGIELVGPIVELARAQFIELPSIAFARGQYLVTWSERESVTAPSQAKLRTLKPDGGSGVLVPLDLGGDGGHDVGVRLAIAPGEASALVTWTRLDAPGLGVPTAYLATMNVGLAQGQSCASGGECSTGNCVNNVCCNEACNAGCGECNGEGVCVPKAFGVTCQAVTECTDAPAFCDAISLVCPSQTPANEGNACGDGGFCAAGVCITSDAGTVSSTDGGVARDAGITDEGPADAGLSDAGTVDGETNISHYSWAQGCTTHDRERTVAARAYSGGMARSQSPP